MPSLRKMAEQLDESCSTKKRKNSNNTSEIISKKAENSDKSTLNLQDLPIELYYMLFENLDSNSLIQIRQLNHNFKQIIDNCKFIWQKKMKINIILDNIQQLCHLTDFLNMNKNINSIEIECSKLLNINKLLETKCCNNLLKIKLNKLNLYNLNILFQVFQNCNNLIINSFNMISKCNSFFEINKLKSFEPSRILTQVLNNNVKELKINCVLYDKIMCKFNNLCYMSAILSNLNLKLNMLNELTIQNYNYTSSNLIKIFNCKDRFQHLKSLKFEYSTVDEVPVEELFERMSKKSRIRIESLCFNQCKFKHCEFVLSNIVNLKYLKELKLFYTCNEFELQHDIDQKFKEFLNKIDFKLKNLSNFETNLSYKFIKLVNFQFGNNNLNKLSLRPFMLDICGRQIKQLNNFDMFSLDTLTDFLNQYLVLNKSYLFENLTCFTFFLNVDCTVLINELKLFSSLLYKMKKNFLNLNMICVHMNCKIHSMQTTICSNCNLFNDKINLFFSDHSSNNFYQLKHFFALLNNRSMSHVHNSDVLNLKINFIY